MPAGLSELEIEQRVMASDRIRATLEGKSVDRFIHVPGRLVNIVTA
jgi:leucyl-tRNA synthetase